MTDDDQRAEEQKEHGRRVQQGANEVIDASNGFDLIAIRQQFKAEAEDLSSLMQQRAMVFLLLRGEGKSDADAYQESMNMRSRAVEERLVDHCGEPEVFPDEPETPQGKGDSQLRELQTT